MTTVSASSDLLLAAAAALENAGSDYTRKLAADLKAAAGESSAADLFAAERVYQALLADVTVEAAGYDTGDLSLLAS